MAFVASLIFSFGAVILIKALVKAFNVPAFTTLSIAIVSSYILMMLSMIHNLISNYNNNK
jgi:hypothetical protein